MDRGNIMIYIHLYIMLALALAGVYVAHKSKLPALYIIVAVALMVAAAGVWTGGLYPAQTDLCLNDTVEDSRYWNCTWYDNVDLVDVNGTCDSVNVTYNYDYCSAAGVSAAENAGTEWVWVFVLLALLLIGRCIIDFMGGRDGATQTAKESSD